MSTIISRCEHKLGKSEEKIENFLFLFLVSFKIYFFITFIGANSIIIDFYFL